MMKVSLSKQIYLGLYSNLRRQKFYSFVISLNLGDCVSFYGDGISIRRIIVASPL